MTSAQLSILQLLSTGPKGAPELSDPQIGTILELVHNGLAYDYADFDADPDNPGRRTDVRLRIWGLTQAGRTALCQSKE